MTLALSVGPHFRPFTRAGGGERREEGLVGGEVPVAIS